MQTAENSARSQSGDINTQAVDVVVVGGGLAGYCAALEAADAGAQVVLCEREPVTGGATVLSGGSFAFADTDLQRQRGLKDSPELLFEDLRKVGSYKNMEPVVRLYVQHQLEAYEWLRRLGVTFDKVFIASGQSVPRAHSKNPRQVLDIVIDEAHRKGIRTHLSTRVHRLTQSAPGGRVTGVLINTSKGLQQLRAKHGVVLATGGFSRNERLLELFAPGQARAQRMGSPGNEGDGLLMAWQLGASFRDMGYIKGTFGSHPSAGATDHFILFPIYAGAIAVNTDGQRFTDESRSYKLIGDACLKQPNAQAFQVFDQKIFSRKVPGIPSMDFDADLAAGRIISAPTVEDLARELNIDPTRLAATVAQYNVFAELNRDRDFGRSSLCNGFGSLTRIDTAPFYGYPSTSVVLATYCGLSVNDQMQVLDVFDEVIPGLYAAGGVIGGFHGTAYMTGTANGKATIFGRVAGRQAAANPIASEHE